jgi:hypothetical protein
MTKRDDLRDKLKQRVKGETWQQDKHPALLGASDGTIRVDVADRYVYVRTENGDTLIVWNERVQELANLPIWIGFDQLSPRRLQVLGARDVYTSPMGVNIPTHHENHEWLNSDTVWVKGQQLLPLLITPVEDMTVRIHPGEVMIWDAWREVIDQELDLTSHIPTAGARWALIEIIDATGTQYGVPHVVDGTIVEDNIGLLNSMSIPAPSDDGVPIAAIKMYDGQAVITQNQFENDILDLRMAQRIRIPASQFPEHHTSHEEGGDDEVNHYDLPGLQGGTTNQFYHLTADEHDGLTDGEVTELHSHPGGGGDVATDAIWNVKGDVAVATGDNAAVRIPVGSNGEALLADSTETAGVKWGVVGGAPSGASYVVEDLDGGLSNERLLSDVIASNTHALRATPYFPGRLYYPTDGVYIGRDTGTVWETWGPVFKLTRPINANFNWVNQESAYVSDASGALWFYDALDASGIKIRKKAIPSASYLVVIGFIPALYCAEYNLCGMCLRESSSGKLILMHIVGTPSANNFTLQISKWDDPTTFNSNYLSIPMPLCAGPMIFFAIKDDGTDRKFYWSFDSQNFREVFSVGRTDYMTADEVGAHVASLSSSYAAAMTWLHWKETTL